LKRAILKAVQDPLAEEILAGGYRNGSTVKCDVDGSGFKFVKG
jgi:ATP-dependent Clp protease ATP-binding subunit ClpA